MSDLLGIHGTALALREQRLQLLAANVANADTPNYKAQDLDFNSALQLALQPSLDGNTVDSDREHAAFAQASLEYRASLSFVESKVRSMLTAITGQ